MRDARQTFFESLNGLWKSIVERLPYLMVGILAILIVGMIGVAISTVFQRISDRTGLHGNLKLLISRLIRIIAWTIGTLVAGTIIFPEFRLGDLVAGLGLTTLAVGFAFKEVLENFFAGVLILWREPFLVGDEVRTNDLEGIVVEINSRSTHIRTWDGEIAIIPNGKIYGSTILVRTRLERRRSTLIVRIGYDSSLEEAKQAMMEAVHSVETVLPEPAPFIYTSDLSPSYIELKLYYWTPSKNFNVLGTRTLVADAAVANLMSRGIQVGIPTPKLMLEEFGEEEAAK
jgi:small conductance mechanosensitive channel